ncbi:MAG TPA: cytochrome c [Burkholderiales bacterium]|nr:cytochrome c [Burkholderiales bacterium]
MRSPCRDAANLAIMMIVSGCFLTTAGAQDVQRGEYLARAGDCISCHTAKGGVPYAGGLRMDTPFGYLLTPNITPDPETGIGRWSADDFYRAMHDGVNKHNQDMYPAMPYTFFTKVTRADCDAIYAYLRTLSPVRNEVEINHLNFPFDYRRTMGFWRELYFTAGTFEPDPTRTPSWNRGAYLVEGLGHCSACHSPRNALGGIEKNKQFTGATIDGWFALNLTSNLSTGLGDWTAADIATYLKTGSSKEKSTVLGPMAEVVQNSLRYLTDADLNAMAEYLKSLPPNSSLRTGAPVPDPNRRKGAMLYMENCGDCHQAKGRGVPGVFPPLAGNGVIVAPDPANILKVVLRGIPARNGYIAMPSFAQRLNDKAIAEIADYVRTSWGNSAQPSVTTQMVGKLRATTK